MLPPHDPSILWFAGAAVVPNARTSPVPENAIVPLPAA